MAKAFCMIREQPCYRRDGFRAGLKAAGYDVRSGGPTGCNPGDVLVTWNRYAEFHEIATRFEKQGGTVIVAENGYVGPGGISPHAMEPRQIYALAIGGHNGSGVTPGGGPDRWDALGIELKPWRGGEYILVCPNRSFGRPDMIMPLRWAEQTAEALRRTTKYPVRIRPHPGNGQPKVPLAQDLEKAQAVHIWSSSAGVHSLIAGVVTVCYAPYWICGADDWRIVFTDTPDKRLKCMQRLAWAQWHIDEIATGLPFKRLIECTSTKAVTSTA